LTGGPARFTQDFTSPTLLGDTPNGAHRLRLRDYHPLRHGFPTDFDLTMSFLLRTSTAALVRRPHNPHTATPAGYHTNAGLASSAFARHYSRNHYCLLFLWVLRCFTSPRSLRLPYFIQTAVTPHDWCWVSPFGHPRITARLPAPQGLSQAPTSFIGSWCQGIHHAPLITCHTPQQPAPERTDRSGNATRHEKHHKQ
jgi:hypothetical protein